MGELYNWVEWSKWLIYEGLNLVAVGNRGSGYSVHEKGKVTICDDRVTFQHKGFYGTYNTKREALGCLRLVDSAFDKGKRLVLRLSGGDPEEFGLGGAWSAYMPKTGATIIIYHEDYPSDLLHELEHERLGHFKERVTPEQELEVVRNTIGELRKLGLYTPKERERTIDLLSGYLKGKGVSTKVVAESIVSNLEEGCESSACGVKWKVRRGRLN